MTRGIHLVKLGIFGYPLYRFIVKANTTKRIFDQIVDTLKSAVKKRVETSKRSVACLLSGGLDSSLIAALAARYYDNLNTYSIGMEGSEDLCNARIVAQHIGSIHEIILTEDEFFNAIPEVIKTIEASLPLFVQV